MSWQKVVNIIFFCLTFSGCAGTYTIDSIPPQARVFIDGELRGETPFTDIESGVWIGTKHQVTLTKEGFQPSELILKPTQWVGQRVVLALIFPPAWLWVKTYPEQFTSKLQEIPFTSTPEEEELKFEEFPDDWEAF